MKKIAILYVGRTYNLQLYNQDRRVGKERINVIEMSISQETAIRANEMICEHFRVTEPWDQKLFAAAFSSDIEFNLFEFGRTDSRDIIQGIEVSGDRNVLFSQPLEMFDALDRGERKVNVTFLSMFYPERYDLTLDDLRGGRKGDLAVVALYNAESYSRCNQGSTNFIVDSVENCTFGVRMTSHTHSTNSADVCFFVLSTMDVINDRLVKTLPRSRLVQNSLELGKGLKNQKSQLSFRYNDHRYDFLRCLKNV